MKCIVCNGVVGRDETCKCSATPKERRQVQARLDAPRHQLPTREELLLQVIRLQEEVLSWEVNAALEE